MFTANDESSMYPRWPEGRNDSLRDQQFEQNAVQGHRQGGSGAIHHSSITRIRMIVTIVMLFKLELAMVSVSEASGAAPLT